MHYQSSDTHIEFVQSVHNHWPSDTICDTPCGRPLLSVMSGVSDSAFVDLEDLAEAVRISHSFTDPLAEPALASFESSFWR